MAAGTIRKRVTKHGIRWQAVVDLGPHPVTGKRRQRSRFCLTEREAKKALADLQVQADRGLLAPRSTHTVEALCRHWLDTYARFKSEKTWENYERTLTLHVIPHLGAVKAHRLSTSQVRAWMAGLLTCGVGTRTVQLAVINLRQVLDQALADGVVPQNVARGIAVPQPADRGRERVIWTADEAQRLLAAAAPYDATYGPIWLVSLGTGMRRGELLGLRWSDVDGDAGLLHVRQAVGVARKRLGERPLKNKSSRRDVLVDPPILAALREHRARQNARRLRLGAAWNDHDLVFCSDIGTPINPSNLWRLYQKVLAAAGVPRIRIHDQRHTHVTWALEDGADLKAVSERVGHASTHITANLYQKVTRKLAEDVAHKTAARLFAQG